MHKKYELSNYSKYIHKLYPLSLKERLKPTFIKQAEAINKNQLGGLQHLKYVNMLKKTFGVGHKLTCRKKQMSYLQRDTIWEYPEYTGIKAMEYSPEIVRVNLNFQN